MSHTHKHDHDCTHLRLSYCSKCRVVYCKDCGEEWGKNWYYNPYYPYIQYTFTDYPNTVPCATTTGIYVNDGTVKTTVTTPCDHRGG